jgi:hypothetical protein
MPFKNSILKYVQNLENTNTVTEWLKKFKIGPRSYEKQLNALKPCGEIIYSSLIYTAIQNII